MTFTKYLTDQKWFFYEQGMQATWNRLYKFASGTTVGTFVAGAGMIGAIEMDAASNPGLTATVGVDTHGAGQQDLPNSDAGSLWPKSTADDKVPPTQFES